jgi:hypothetical protein
MPFGDVTDVPLPMNFDMVPGLVFGRTALGHDFIPFLSIIELRVDAQNQPVVVKLFMMDQLSNAIFGFGFIHSQ